MPVQRSVCPGECETNSKPTHIGHGAKPLGGVTPTQRPVCNNGNNVASSYVQWSPLCPIVCARGEGNGKMIPLKKSMCLLHTFWSLIGKRTPSFPDIQARVANRGETVMQEGWHSIQQLNGVLATTKSVYQCVKAKVPKSTNWETNPFLQQQRSGLFILSARVESARTQHQNMLHFVGVDCWAREFVDVFLKTRRPMTATEWEKIGVTTWETTHCICEVRGLSGPI